MSLRRILGKSGRVRKASTSSGAKASSTSSWASSLPRSKPGSRSKSKSNRDTDDDSEDFFDDKLDDYGLVTALATDQTLRDTPQAIRYIMEHMFSALPDERAGLSSARIADVLNYRKQFPPLVTVSHIQTLLSSPSAVEREVAELSRAGFLRKIVVARRGDIGETLILTSDLERMIDESTDLSQQTRENFKAFLMANPATQTVPRTSLSPSEVDQLFKAGFVTAHHMGTSTYSTLSSNMNMYSRPEDKTTLVSLETVSKQAAGSLGAVGGEGALHQAGGSGGGSRTLPASVTELRIAVPGNGTFLKLASSALEHLTSLLGKSRFKEAPETLLNDRWDGGVSKEEARYTAKRLRGEFVGILPGQTRKWRQFHGLSFEWVLQEAVGAGLIEVFETRSVGRGVRIV